MMNPLISDRADARATDTAASNLAAVVATLQKEIDGLRQQNAQLAAQLQAVHPSTSPDDFAAAVQRSVDKLQTQLATMTNPVSNFAVREFRLETNVQLEVTALGDLRYHFVAPDAKLDPGVLSRIALDLVPVPKQTAAGVFTAGTFKPQTTVGEIVGLTPNQQVILHGHQIDTVGDFLAAATRARSSIELAALLEVDRRQLAGWVASAELLTIDGIDGARAAVLVEAGVSGIAALAALEADHLLEQFRVALSKTEHKTARPLDTTEATRWIQAARAYLGHAAPAPGKAAG